MAPRSKPRVTRAKATNYFKKKRSTNHTLTVGDGSNASAAGQITTTEPPKKKGRGLGKIKKVKEDPDECPVIWIVGPHEFSCAKKPRLITAMITRLALRLMPAPVRSFHAFCKDTKLNLEREFLARYRYKADEDPDRCREVLEAIACKRYCEELGTARRNRIKLYGWDIMAWKANVPLWCVTPVHWRGLCDIWFSEEWQLVSKQNQQNRTTSNSSISHYAGSASAHQHFEKLTKLNKGIKPTMEDLYIHIHCSRQNGVSPVVAQLSTAEEVTANNENSEANGGVEPAAKNSIGQVHEFDINSLKFADENKENFYVKAMRADEANANLDESTLFLTALGGPSHGRIKGFGSVLQPKKTATTRERQSHATSSISELTNSGVQETFSRAEVDAMVQEHDFRIVEERAERKRDQEQNELMFSALFRMHGLQKPPLAPASNSQAPTNGTVGNMGYSQVNGPTAHPPEEGPSQLQMEFNPDVAVPLQPNQGGSFQALMSSQSAQEITGNDADLTNWWGDQPSI